MKEDSHDTIGDSSLSVTLTVGQLRELVRQEIQAGVGQR